MPNLDSLLGTVARDVARYAGLPPKLDAFPITTKVSILADLDAHLSRTLGERRELLECLRSETRGDSKFESVFNERILIEETSGSSGIPFRIPKLVEERVRVSACLWRFRRRYDPTIRPERLYPFIHEPRGFQGVGYPYELDAAGVDRLYAGISERGCTWLHGEPNLLCWHAERITEARVRSMSPRFAECTGMRMSAEDRAVIEGKLRVRLIDQYGSREAWGMGIRDADGAFEVLTDNVVIELVDDAGVAIDAPDVPGRLVVTCLHQRMFPFIRYDTGDSGIWEQGQVGRRFVLCEIRDNNRLLLGTLELDGSAFFKNMLFLSFRDVGHVNLSYVQVRQLAEKRFLLVTSRSPKAPALRDALGRLMAGGIHHAFPRDAEFELLQLSQAELDRERRGKQTLFTTKYLERGE